MSPTPGFDMFTVFRRGQMWAHVFIYILHNRLTLSDLGLYIIYQKNQTVYLKINEAHPHCLL